MRSSAARLLIAAALPLALGSVLSSCARTVDTFKPRIVISSPDGGGVSRQRNFTVQGYALDDIGVTRLSVDGKAIPIPANSRKIANFQFKTVVQGSKGQFTIKATDAAGNESTLVLPISVDAVNPAIKVAQFERSGNQIRVSGVATDNTRVVQIIVDGNRLNITPGPRVQFYAETSGVYADVQAIDAAGNSTIFRAR
ncbi:hypothetical protein [Deinococcus sp. QL22]|uniref:hypothetical protein n=1 Tax=Deinococcus sp. QL22 TaxID=2939437 RepID=UPI002016D88E|nr:hypothetical protein [Deinococcus sp. QL22]UQN06853.1 hypothetical protein M1R55_02710 [Deinococcus sp. QL22]